MRYYLQIRSKEDAILLGQEEPPVVGDEYFTETSAKYVNQLLHENDWQTALQVCLLIPNSRNVIRSKLLLKILCMQAPSLVMQSSKEIDYITKTLMLPRTWLSTSLALCYQHFFLNEKAIDEWFKADDVNQAHSIFYRRVLPLYMHKSTRVSMVKALLQKDDGVTNAKKKAWFDNNEICMRNNTVDKLITKFDNGKINEFSQHTGLFQKFVSLINKLSKVTHGGPIEVSSNMKRIE